MRESQVEKHLIKRVTETGGSTRKVKWIARRGAPDRLVGWPRNPERPYTCPARHALIELKRPGGAARAAQEREHAHLRAIGFDVRVLDTIEAVDKFVEELCS